MKSVLAVVLVFFIWGCEVYATEEFLSTIKPEYSYQNAFNYPIIPSTNGFTIPIEKFTLDPDTTNYCNRLLKTENIFVKIDKNGNVLSQIPAKIVNEKPNLGTLKRVANGEYWGVVFRSFLSNASLDILRFDTNYNQVGTFSFKSNEIENISGFVPKPTGGVLAFGMSASNLIVVEPEQKKIGKIALNTSDYVRSAYADGEKMVFWIGNYTQIDRKHILLYVDKDFKILSKTEIASPGDISVVSDFYADGTPFLFEYNYINTISSLRIFKENGAAVNKKEMKLSGIFQSIVPFESDLLLTTYANKIHETLRINAQLETSDFFKSPIDGKFFKSGSTIVKLGKDISNNKVNRYALQSDSETPKVILQGQNYNKCYDWGFF